jgi:hypothetical protein
MPRFVLLLHETPPGYPRPTHYDLMLEHGDVLWTWALEAFPEAHRKIAAERLHDHRPVYLDFEGDVAGDRGSVRRVDQGHYDLISNADGSFEVELHGSLVRGRLYIGSDVDHQRCWIWLSPR